MSLTLSQQNGTYSSLRAREARNRRRREFAIPNVCGLHRSNASTHRRIGASAHPRIRASAHPCIRASAHPRIGRTFAAHETVSTEWSFQFAPKALLGVDWFWMKFRQLTRGPSQHLRDKTTSQVRKLIESRMATKPEHCLPTSQLCVEPNVSAVSALHGLIRSWPRQTAILGRIPFAGSYTMCNLCAS